MSTQISDGPSDQPRRSLLKRFSPAATAVSAAAASGIPPALAATDDSVVPFRAEFTASAISDLKNRLGRSRMPEKEPVSDWSQGAPLFNVSALLDYWRGKYDMRRLEMRLNSHPQFRTTIEGLGIHFIHVKSKHPQATPLILTHGWPGSVVEFLKVIGPLTDPTAFGGTADQAFHLVIPSLPGFGYSDKPSSRGWGLPKIARAWGVLMQRLGYDNYLAQGGDFGAGVATWMAKLHVRGLAGVHLNLPILFPPPIEGVPSDEEKASIAQLVAYGTDKNGYAHLQMTRPQTVGYSLADSPIGQAAWIYEKLGAWSDSNHRPEDVFSMDEMLDNVMMYWMTDTAASSARIYVESFATDFSPQKLDLPVAVSVFPGELYRPLRVWGERLYSQLVYWAEAKRGGHFAAFEQPQVFAAELRAALPTLRR
jgi:epoxide hydrolase